MIKDTVEQKLNREWTLLLMKRDKLLKKIQKVDGELKSIKLKIQKEQGDKLCKDCFYYVNERCCIKALHSDYTDNDYTKTADDYRCDEMVSDWKLAFQKKKE